MWFRFLWLWIWWGHSNYLNTVEVWASRSFRLNVQCLPSYVAPIYFYYFLLLSHMDIDFTLKMTSKMQPVSFRCKQNCLFVCVESLLFIFYIIILWRYSNFCLKKCSLRVRVCAILVFFFSAVSKAISIVSAPLRCKEFTFFRVNYSTDITDNVRTQAEISCSLPHRLETYVRYKVFLRAFSIFVPYCRITFKD